MHLLQVGRTRYIHVFIQNDLQQMITIDLIDKFID